MTLTRQCVHHRDRPSQFVRRAGDQLAGTPPVGSPRGLLPRLPLDPSAWEAPTSNRRAHPAEPRVVAMTAGPLIAALAVFWVGPAVSSA
jgi:hypothetical protein